MEGKYSNENKLFFYKFLVFLCILGGIGHFIWDTMATADPISGLDMITLIPLLFGWYFLSKAKRIKKMLELDDLKKKRQG